MTAQEIINKLNLIPHPEEGGYYIESWRSRELIHKKDLPDRYSGSRAFSTCIYYLLTPETFSEIHRLESEEIFHFYLGDPVEMLQLYPDGSGKKIILGSDIMHDQQVQTVVEKNVWQGSRLIEGGSYALLGCTVAPGFDFSDYEQGRRNELIRSYPGFEISIIRLTHH